MESPRLCGAPPFKGDAPEFRFPLLAFSAFYGEEESAPVRQPARHLKEVGGPKEFVRWTCVVEVERFSVRLAQAAELGRAQAAIPGPVQLLSCAAAGPRRESQ